MTRAVLTLNAGSSSIKFSLYELENGGGIAAEPVLSGQIDGIGVKAHIKAKDDKGKKIKVKVTGSKKGYASKTIKEIVREIYTYADIMTISAKKDGVVNMGGFVAMRSEELYKRAMTFSIMFEGYVTYGGMSGRDMDALAVGLDENTEYEQLDARIRQVKLLGDLLDEYGVPYQRPAGGHAIFVDAKKVLPNLPKEQFIAQTLAVELYLEAGIRGVEIGSM